MAHALAAARVAFGAAVAAAASVAALTVSDFDAAAHHAARQEQTQNGNQTCLHRVAFGCESPAV